MTEQTRSEELYMILIDTLNELAELESPEIIFDYIVDNFAAEAEYHMGQANTYQAMLDTFRHDNPTETIPEAPEPTGSVDLTAPPNIEDLYGGVNDINRQYMLEDRDNLLEFLKNAHFPDTLGS